MWDYQSETRRAKRKSHILAPNDYSEPTLPELHYNSLLFPDGSPQHEKYDIFCY